MAKHKTKISVYSEDEFRVIAETTLNKCPTVDLLILKGHSLMEYILNCAVIIGAAESTHMELQQLSFQHKLLIVSAYTEIDKTGIDIEAVNLLTKLRNDIAHKLDYNKHHLSTFLGRFSKQVQPIDQRNQVALKSTLHSVLGHLCGLYYATFVLIPQLKLQVLTVHQKSVHKKLLALIAQ